MLKFHLVIVFFIFFSLLSCEKETDQNVSDSGNQDVTQSLSVDGDNGQNLVEVDEDSELEFDTFQTVDDLKEGMVFESYSDLSGQLENLGFSSEESFYMNGNTRGFIFPLYIDYEMVKAMIIIFDQIEEANNSQLTVKRIMIRDVSDYHYVHAQVFINPELDYPDSEKFVTLNSGLIGVDGEYPYFQEVFFYNDETEEFEQLDPKYFIHENYIEEQRLLNPELINE